jgi:manganese/zinc/iron transport system ATP- binding protein
MNPAVTVRDLTVAYREEPVLWDIDLDVPEGTLTAIIGPNGAGKSTLVKAMLGLVHSSSGMVRIYGRPYDQVRQRVAYVPQRGEVDWDFPTDALDVVLMGLYGQIGWLKRAGKKHRKKAMECLDQVGMADFAHRQISQLSGGQQQRVFLARALAQDADLYVMDEPFAGVDAVTETAIVKILHELRSQGRTALVVHHDLDTAPEYFDRVVLLNVRLIADGVMSETFTTEKIRAAYGSRVAAIAQ